MDSLITAAARALAAGDALGALSCVALRDDPDALALRGIAMARLEDYPRARALLRRAARGFEEREVVARARCVVAEAEVALILRDLGGSPKRLLDAAVLLEAHGDRANAALARVIAARRSLLLGRLDQAAAELPGEHQPSLPSALRAMVALTRAELALRSLDPASGRAALAQARELSRRADVPALVNEVAQLYRMLEQPAARQLVGGRTRTLRLDDVAALFASDAMIIDACRHGVRAENRWEPLARRPVLFALVSMLARDWPREVARDVLITGAFRTRHINDSHRARLRVELSRLRKLLSWAATIEATAGGFRVVPRAATRVTVLMPPVDGEQAALLALLADGTAWSTSALALALDASQRTVQRALTVLQHEGRVRAVGRTRARRWVAPPLTEFTTLLLLPATPGRE